MLIPPPDPFGIPAPAWVFILLLNLTLVLHFIAMGYVFTASLLQVVWALAAKPGSAAEWMLRRSEGPLPVALSFTITLGVAPLLFVQVLYGQFFYTANILIGHQWFGIIPMVMVGFYLIYLLYGGRVLNRRIPRPLEAFGRLIMFLCFLYLMVTHTINAVLVQHPEQWQAVHLAGGNPGVIVSPILWPRLAHNVLGAFVIGSVWLVALGARSACQMEDRGIARDDNHGFALLKLGSLLGGCVLFFQVFVGLWLTVAQPKPVQEMLFSGRPAAILWMVSLAGVLGLLMLLLVSMALYRNRVVIWSNWIALSLVLAGMFAAREAARQVRLAPYFKVEDWPVNLQISSLALFLALFVVALVLIGVMIRWLIQAAGPAGERNAAAQSDGG